METAAPAFTAWLDDFFAAYYLRRPVNATFIGMHDYDNQLPDLSASGIATVVAELGTLRRRLADLPAEPLTTTELLDRRLADAFLEIAQWEYDSGYVHRHNPSFYTGEAIFGVIGLLLRPFAPLAQRVESAIARLAGTPALLAQGQENVREAPAAWVDRASAESHAAHTYLLTRGLDSFIQEHGLDGTRLQQGLYQAATIACAAFQDFERYLHNELRQHSNDNYACGEAAYNLLLHKGHFLDRDAAAIETYALDQAELAEAYLRDHANDFGANSWPEALAGLTELHVSADAYYERFEQIWIAARAAAEHAQLVTWPDFPISYVPQPVWVREAAPHLYFLPYRSPAPFDNVLPVHYLVPPIEPDMDLATQERRLQATNDSVITLNHVIHHGGLGHHVQNYRAYHAASRIGQIAAVDCASRIAMFCGGTMAEGWACYATDMMAEIGFLTPRQHFAEMHTRLRMAARAIVDVRLHHGTFTLDQAAAYYRDRVGMAAEAAQGEAIKNSMFPATAAMYLMGTDQIHDLRSDLAAQAGPSFDLRRFHDKFLSFGSIPVSLVCAALREEASNAR